MKKHIAKITGLTLSLVLWVSLLLFLPVNGYGYLICGLMCTAMIGAGFYFDARVRRLELERLDKDAENVHGTLVFAMQHILNNFFNGMELVRMEAQACAGFDPHILDLYDEAMRDAVRKVQNISETTDLSHSGIWKALYPDMRYPLGKRG